MLLSDLLDQLTYGELANFEYSGVDDEGFVADNYKRIIPHINLGLTELHKRFPLRIEELILDCEDHIQTYHLTYEYARTNTESSQPYKYIHDTSFQPFHDNVLKVEKVFNENGKELYLNTKGAVSHIGESNVGKLGQPGCSPLYGMDTGSAFWGVHTPTFNSIQIPYPMETNALLVEYRANHPKIQVKDLNPATTEINIPSWLLEALLQYIAARAYTSLGGDSAQEGNNFMAKFEASVKTAEQLGLSNTDTAINQKLEVNGWL